MTQAERLFEHLKVNQVINPLTAWTELGIYRLSAVIFLLRKAGYEIETNLVEVRNKFNEPVMFAEYKFITNIAEEVKAHTDALAYKKASEEHGREDFYKWFAENPLSPLASIHLMMIEREIAASKIGVI